MKKTKLNFRMMLVLMASLFVLFSCEKATTVNVQMDPIDIVLDEINVEEEETPSKGLRPFHEERAFNLAELTSAAATVAKYKSKIEKVEVGELSITIYSKLDGGTVVEDFVLKAEGVSGNISIPHYELGTAYTGNNDGSVLIFGAQVLYKLFSNESITFDVSGKTDILLGKNLSVRIAMGKIVLVTKPLKTK